MSPTEAAKLLELPTDATPEQLETRFLDLRRKLEDKIAKAPTPGLQAKYRETLVQITAAFEILTLAADSSSLPVLEKPSAISRQPSAGDSAFPRAAAPAAAAPIAKKKPGGNKEFVFVALIAVALLGAGGWWVLHLRAEKAEQVRLAAVAAEAKAQAETAAKAEADRLASQATGLRTKLAETRVEWDALESDLRDAERRASELKSELRGARDLAPAGKAELSAQATAQEMYTAWLKNFLLRSPVKVARARTEELLQAKEVDAATESCAEMLASLAEVTHSVRETQNYFLNMTGALGFESTPSGVAWIMTDPYGRVTEGKTTATLNALPLTHLATTGDPSRAGPDDFKQRGEFTTGKYVVRFVRTGWPEVVREATLVGENDVTLSASFPEGTLKVESLPASVPFTASNHLGWSVSGQTPATVEHVPPGRITVRLSRAGYQDVSQNVEVVAGKIATPAPLDQRSQTVNITVAEAKSKIFVDRNFAGYEKATLSELLPGEHDLQIEAAGYSPYRMKFTVKQEAGNRMLPFSFKDLATQNITCSNCSGAGSINHAERCNQCNGRGRVDCPDCQNGIAGYVDGDYGGGVIGAKMVMCKECAGKGTLPCTACTDGIYRWTENCGACGGDGRVSKLQLSQ
jgi:hypothetical protein